MDTIEAMNIYLDSPVLDFVLGKQEGAKKPLWYAEVGEYLIIITGGLQPRDKGFEVIERKRGEHWHELDWKGTSLYTKSDKVDSGWVTPNGTWYGCSYMMHDTVARLMSGNKQIVELEEQGWCRVYGIKGMPPFHCDRRLTAEQRNELSKRGFLLEDFD